MKTKRPRQIELSFSNTSVDFILQTHLFDSIEVAGSIKFSRRSYKKSLFEQWSTVQTILSEYE